MQKVVCGIHGGVQPTTVVMKHDSWPRTLKRAMMNSAEIKTKIYYLFSEILVKVATPLNSMY